MKQFALFSLILLLGLSVAFYAGRRVENFANGFRFEIREERFYDTPLGQIHWAYVTERVGVPFLDPGKSIIEWNGRRLYGASVVFQEGLPFAQNITVKDSTLKWDDREYQYSLTIERVAADIEGEPGAGLNSESLRSSP